MSEPKLTRWFNGKTRPVRVGVYLRDFADKTGAGYDQMMRIAETHCEGERFFADYLIEGGRWEGQETPDEFWTHFKAVTGKAPKDDEKPGIFSCSC